MQESFIQNLFAQRIGGSNFGKDTSIYKFEKIKTAKRQAKESNPNTQLIDLGIGEPDGMPDAGVINTLFYEVVKPENKGYADNGVFEFKQAAAEYLKEVYGVSEIDSHIEINHAIGSKSAFAMIPAIFINPGDITLMTVPGYPVMGTHTKWYDGEVVNLPLKKENNFLPVLDELNEDIKNRAKLLYINYPNNPTGASATYEFFEEVVHFAKQNNIIVIHDAAYSAITFDGEKPLSFLSVPGAKGVGVEIHSLSKSFNMTGWRLAFVAGNELIVKGFASVKDNVDSGQFIPIQKAGVYALKNPHITEKINEKYSRRHNMIVSALKELGFNITKPKGSFYLYVEIPKAIKGGQKFENAEEFSQFLIKEKLISTVPWDEQGHFIRLSVTFEANGEDEEKKVVEQIKNRLSDLKFEF